MKPDKYGTPHEQALHRIGWTARADWPWVEKKGICQHCKHYELRFDKTPKGSPFCWLMEYRTQIRSGCNLWEKER